jgi:hypothetical protein
MKPIAHNTIVSAYYIHFDYFLSCIPVNGRILKLEGRFVTREVCTFISYNITRFVPVDDCHRDCIRNNTRVPGELCVESLYDNYEAANQALLEKLRSSENTLQDIIGQINENISRTSEVDRDGHGRPGCKQNVEPIEDSTSIGPREMLLAIKYGQSSANWKARSLP